MTLTDAQISIVKSTAPVLKQHGEAITTVFYGDLITENPSLKNIFSLTSQATGAQPRALAHAVLAYATYIDNLSALSEAVARIAHKHVSLQVEPAQYAIVGQYLIQAIGKVLGDAATPEIVDAWTAAYGVLANVFIGVEGGMYEENEKKDHWKGWRKFRIARKVEESSSISSFYLRPVDGATLPKYLPGQYVSVQVLVSQLGYLQSRQYSLSEAPKEGGMEEYRISVKREEGETGAPGLVSNLLHGMQEGAEVEVSHPQGEFFLDPADASKEGVPAVLISVGVGATPMMAILKSLLQENVKRRPVSWIHASKSSSTQPFGEEVRRIVKENPEQVSAHVFLKTMTGTDQAGVHYDFADTRMDLTKLDGERDLHLADKRTEYYICGPEPFMVEIRKVLVGLGVDKSKVHLELFATGFVADE
ncbi:globin-like protein [Neurospora hispaniola]|uniref:nitric oxide dioxygenase n=1 Tax=Neurospora hispaniola TaxID=588809 RepID=A0AAJ0MLX7_9PEZI|nr:globin-like protein [Neurospora hispaniola]